MEPGWIRVPDVIRVAERDDLINALTLAVAERVVHDRAVLMRADIGINRAFNVSMHNLHNLSIAERMSEIGQSRHGR